MVLPYIFIALPVVTASIEPAIGSCKAGDSQCTEGLAMLQKAQQRSQVLIEENETKPSGGFPHDQNEFLHPEASGIAAMAKAATVALGDYPGYSGSMRIRGDIKLTSVGDAGEGGVVLSYSMTGTDNLCIVAADGSRGSLSGPEGKVENSCGMVVHDGKSCFTADDVGAPLHRPDAHDVDPLQDSFYASYGRKAENSTSVLVLRLGDVIGRTFVVHSHSGDRVACGVIKADPDAADPKPIESTTVAAGLSFAALLATSAMLSVINM